MLRGQGAFAPCPCFRHRENSSIRSNRGNKANNLPCCAGKHHGHHVHQPPAHQTERPDDGLDAGTGAVQRCGLHLRVPRQRERPDRRFAGLFPAERHDRGRRRHRCRRQRAAVQEPRRKGSVPRQQDRRKRHLPRLLQLCGIFCHWTDLHEALLLCTDQRCGDRPAGHPLPDRLLGVQPWPVYADHERKAAGRNGPHQPEHVQPAHRCHRQHRAGPYLHLRLLR